MVQFNVQIIVQLVFLSNSLILCYNAALRGECRINQLPADRLHHQNSLQTKNATRHESLLNALLCAQLIDEHPSLFRASYSNELYVAIPRVIK